MIYYCTLVIIIKSFCHLRQMKTVRISLITEDGAKTMVHVRLL